MLIKILGSGCAKCNRLEQLTREAVGELGIAATFEASAPVVSSRTASATSRPSSRIDSPPAAVLPNSTCIRAASAARPASSPRQ